MLDTYGIIRVLTHTQARHVDAARNLLYHNLARPIGLCVCKQPCSAIGAGFLCVRSADMISKTEEWRSVVNTDGRYEVSDMGHVRSTRNRYGNPRVKLLAAYLSSGYPTVSIRRLGWNRTRPVSVHMMIAEAFIGPCPDGHEVNHKDFSRANSVLDNLEYVTYSENNLHAFRNGRQPVRGSRVGASKLKEAEIVVIRASNEPHTVLAKRYGVHPTTILRVRTREQWSQVK